jgi:hypothetical protein
VTERHVLVLLSALIGCPRQPPPAVLPSDFIGGYVLETTLPGAQLLLLPDGRAQLLSMPGHHSVSGWSLEWENREGGLYFRGDLPELLFPRLYLLLPCDGNAYMVAAEGVGGDLNCDAVGSRDDLVRLKKVIR